MQDFTSPEQLQDAPPASAAHYRALFERAPVGIIIGIADGTCIEANHSMCRMLGYTRKELVGMHRSAYVTGNEIPVGTATLDAIGDNSASREVRQFVRKDGTTFEAETLTTLMPDGCRLMFIRDIAERKREDARIRRLIDSNVQGVMIWNSKGDVATANEAFLDIIGYTREDLEAGRIDWLAMTPVEYEDVDRHALEELSTKGKCTPFEKEYIRKNGTRVAVLLGAANFEDSRKEGVCFVLDITARKQAEDEHAKLNQHLRDQHFYTRSLIESNLDALLTTDSFAIVTDVNRQMEALTGCTRDELVGATFTSLFTDAMRAEAGIKRVLREGSATNYELTVRARDGRLTVVSLNATTLYDRHRRLQGAFASARDMTEHKKHEVALREATNKAERANREILELNASLEQQVLERTASLETVRNELLKSNERFAIAADSAGIGIWEFDVLHNALTWDDCMYRIYGQVRRADVEPYALWARSLHADDRARCEAQIVAAVRGECEFDTEFRIVRPDGEIRHVKASSRTLRAVDGTALTMTGVNLDVTEQRRAKEALVVVGSGNHM
jgi:PAS domain S-box-containing protein